MRGPFAGNRDDVTRPTPLADRRDSLERTEREDRADRGDRLEQRLLEMADAFENGEPVTPDPAGWQARFDAIAEDGLPELPGRLQDRLAERGFTRETEIGDDAITVETSYPGGASKLQSVALSEDGNTLTRSRETTGPDGETAERTISITVDDDAVTRTITGTTSEGQVFDLQAERVFTETGFDWSVSGTTRNGETVEASAEINFADEILILHTEDGAQEIAFQDIAEMFQEARETIVEGIENGDFGPPQDALIA